MCLGLPEKILKFDHLFILGHHKCREGWPSQEYEKAYNIFLNVILLILPLVIQAATYFSITMTLWQGMQTEKELKVQLQCNNQGM